MNKVSKSIKNTEQQADLVKRQQFYYKRVRHMLFRLPFWLQDSNNKISAVRYYALDNNYFSVNNDGSVIADSLNLYMEIKVYKGEVGICGCCVDGKNF